LNLVKAWIRVLMDYQTYQPDAGLAEFVSCYWTLEVPENADGQKQRVVPDGCVEMIFTLGDDIKRYINDETHIIQPRSMILGQFARPFFIEPTGVVDTFAVRFFPCGLIPFTTLPIRELANRETELSAVLGPDVAAGLEYSIVNAADTAERIRHIETFLSDRLKDFGNIDSILKSTVDLILSTKGRLPVTEMLKDNISKRRQLERRFSRLVGLSPKQLARIVRLQTTLRMLLNNEGPSLTSLAMENQYYDQAHFIKDFRELTGTNPNKFLVDNELTLSAAFYQKN